MYNSIRPGEEWFDTSGKPIHAHGGNIIEVNGTFYWYGENKEKTTNKSRIWHWGVRAYSSKDLYNWKDEGIIVPPSEDENNPLHPSQYMDRPHIIYNEKTNKFVMWIKIMNKDNTADQYMVIASADSVTGPYDIVSVTHPLDMSSGDFDLVVDPKTKKAYIYFDRVHEDMICADLNDEYTDVIGNFTAHLPEPFCPLVREAPAFCERNGKKYLFTSGTTGYLPNPTLCAVSEEYHGPWKNIGTVHNGDKENTSFRSQISAIFKHPYKKDLYIAVADRWLINLPDDMPDNAFEIMVCELDPNKERIAPRETYEYIESLKSFEVRDISKARYVWLPIKFNEDGIPVINWLDEWRIEDYE